MWFNMLTTLASITQDFQLQGKKKDKRFYTYFFGKKKQGLFQLLYKHTHLIATHTF